MATTLARHICAPFPQYVLEKALLGHLDSGSQWEGNHGASGIGFEPVQNGESAFDRKGINLLLTVLWMLFRLRALSTIPPRAGIQLGRE